MGIVRRTIENLLPPSIFQPLKGDMQLLINGLSVSIQEVRDYINQVRAESNPGTANQLLKEWFIQLGILYDETLSVSQRQGIARQIYAATGGQSEGYLSDLIQIAFPGAFVKRQSIYGYLHVEGNVDSFEELIYLFDFVERIAPAEIEPVFLVSTTGDDFSSEVPVAICGYAECNG
jgi:hypothetical protein